MLRRSLRLARGFLLLAAVGWMGAAPAQQDAPPDVLVKDVTLEVIDIIRKDKDIQAGDRKKIIELIEAKVLPHFNFTSMTALAVGTHWPKAAADQKKQLVQEFRTLLVRTYASALTAYRDQKFEFRPLRLKPADTEVSVQVRVLQPGTESVTIQYEMEKTAAGWKVYDVIIGGVSLVANYRTEFANQVRESGIDGLVKTLAAKNRSNATAARAEKK